MSTPREWEVLDVQRPLAVTQYGRMRVRMLCVGIGDGGLLVVSPGGLDDARYATMAGWGTPRFLLAPNHFHSLGLTEWQARFPDAKVVAHAAALPRLTKRLPGLSIAPLSTLEGALPPGVRLLNPPGARQGETWVSVATPSGTCWYVTDAMVNESRLPGGISGWVMWAVGFRTGLMVNPAFKRFFLSNRARYKDWVHAELERDRPTMFVPSHGDILRGADVADRLRAVTDAA